MNVVLSFVLALMAAVGLFTQLQTAVDQTKQESSVPISDLRKAPETIVIDTKSVSLFAFPWRDFMPGSWGAGGSPLMVGVRIISADKQPLPVGIRIDRVWVLFGEQVWEVSELRPRQRGQAPDKDQWLSCMTPHCEFTVRGGPKWGPGGQVDVVVRITDREGRQHLIQAPNQEIKSSH